MNQDELEKLSKKLYDIYCENVGCISMSGIALLDTDTFFSIANQIILIQIARSSRVRLLTINIMENMIFFVFVLAEI